jgi:Cu/Zn superoxide dismutase
MVRSRCSLVVLVVGLAACSGSDGGGNAGRGGGGGSAGGGSGGAASGGRGGTGGVTATMATATINPIGTNTVAGTARFSLNPQGLLSLQINLTNCPPGGHAAHLHEFANCGSNGNDAGNHWVPKGEIIQTITCAADGTATSTTLPTSPGYWTIGGDASSNVLPHAIMIHASPDPSAGARIGCGVATATP